MQTHLLSGRPGLALSFASTLRTSEQVPRLAAPSAAWVDEIIRDVADREVPLELRRLGRTMKRWRDHIVAWHLPTSPNGPTEAVNLVKRVKRVAGTRRFRKHRIRALRDAGPPNWKLLDTITRR